MRKHGRHDRDRVITAGLARPRRVVAAGFGLAHEASELGGGQRGRAGKHEAETHQFVRTRGAMRLPVTGRQYTRRPPMRLLPELVLTADGWRRDVAVTVSDGRITDLGAAASSRAGDVLLPARALLPGTVNAHAHTFQSLLRGLGDDLDFAGWRDRVLYPFSERLDRDGIGLGAAFAFAEMLRHGVTTCVDFFYLNDGGNENAEAVIAAAGTVGIRLVLARTMYDWEGAPKRYRESPAEAARRVRELIAAHRDDPTVNVHAAPHSPHGASPAMIRAGWEVAESEHVPMHIHVAEGRYEGERTLREHGATPLRHLDRLGALGARTIAVHAVWLDDEEVALMGARDAALAYCPSSNMFLGDGVTRLPELLRAGVRAGLGTDGGCTNNRLSVFEEMRMASLLQRVRLLDGGALPATTVWGLGTESGAAMLGLSAGRIEAGGLADLVAIDLGHASLHPPTNLLANVVFAMSPQAITDVWVHGGRVVDAGRLTRVSESELLARVGALTRDWRLGGGQPSGRRARLTGPSAGSRRGMMEMAPLRSSIAASRRSRRRGGRLEPNREGLVRLETCEALVVHDHDP